MNENRVLKFLLLIIGILFLLISIVLPLGTLFIKTFQDREGNFIGMSNFIEYLNNPVTESSLKNSFLVSITVTITVTLLALIFTYGMSRSKIKGKKILELIALLPLFSPTMSHGTALIYLLGRHGIITKLFNLNIDIYGFWGIIIAEIMYIFPILFIMYSLSLKLEDYRTYEAAEMMGINKIKQFFIITIPNIKYTLITGGFAAFTLSFSDFGAPKVIGGNFNVVATDVYKQVVGQQNMGVGSAVGILLIIPAFLAFLVDIIFQKKSIKISSKATKYKIKNNIYRDIMCNLFNYTLVCIILIFFIVVVLASLVKTWPYDMSLNFDAYNFTVMGENIWKIFGNSIFVGVLTALLGTILCFFIAYFIEREKEFIFIRKTGYFLSVLPNAIPGLTIGLAYIFFFNSRLNPLNFLYGSFGILIIANIIHFFTTPFLTITAALKKLDREYETISNLMGVPWYKTVFKVIIPLSLDSILESFSYYFVNSMITISAVVFLYTTSTRVASVMMISKTDSGEIRTASAVAVMIICVNILFKLLMTYIITLLKNKNKILISPLTKKIFMII
ncbi:MAG: putative 2-aminoethylphosphonate ABC transporter permease subunit [Fusobacteriaceae bacterium]